MSTTSSTLEIAGRAGRLHVHHWPCENPRYVLLLAHGYGEHAGRYEHVAQALVAHGADVYAPDHHGHGLSEGDRALLTDFDAVQVADLDAVADLAEAANPGLPLVLLGHSMGGLIATRYAQLHRERLRGLILSGPALGAENPMFGLLELDPIPDVPLDPAVLSRDPAVGEAYAADTLVYHGPFQRPTLEAFLASAKAIEAGPGFGDLPLLHVHGTEDQLVPYPLARAVVERLQGPDSEHHAYEGAMHEVLNETNKDEVIAAVTAFVDRVL